MKLSLSLFLFFFFVDEFFEFPLLLSFPTAVWKNLFWCFFPSDTDSHWGRSAGGEEKEDENS